MSKAMYLTGAYEIDKNFDAIFWTEWDARLASAMELVSEKDIPTDRYSFAEMLVGFATAPTAGEGESYKLFAPKDGKNWSQATDIYKFGFKATEELRDFGRTNQTMEYARLMAQILDHTVKVGIYNKFNRAFSGSYLTPYDNKALCATDHPLANGATASNKLGTDADPSEATYAALIELMLETPNEDGVFMPLVPRTVLTRSSNWVVGTQVTQSSTTTRQGTGESGNAINAVQRAWNLVPHFSPLITDTDATFLVADKSPITLAWTRRPELKPLYIDPMTDDWVWRIKAQFGVFTDNWRGIVGTSGAA